ncbi:unnamed protein product [Arctogadus glacialis]
MYTEPPSTSPYPLQRNAEEERGRQDASGFAFNSFLDEEKEEKTFFFISSLSDAEFHILGGYPGNINMVWSKTILAVWPVECGPCRARDELSQQEHLVPGEEGGTGTHKYITTGACVGVVSASWWYHHTA